MLKTLFSRGKSDASSPVASSPSAWSYVASALGASPRATVDWSDWDVVQVVVPPGPLGIVLDGTCLNAAVVDEFCDLPDGRKGTIELHGGVPLGSVLMSVNEFELLAARKTMLEVGDVLRDSSHLKRVMKFKVPPQPVTPTEAASKRGADKQSLLGDEAQSSDTAPVVAVRKASITDTISTTPVAVTLKAPPLESQLSGKSLDGKFVTVDVPPGPLGLNLDGATPDRAVVLGFVALPDGSKGALEAHGGVKLGSVLVEINGESVVKLPLDAVRAELSALSTEPRRLVFRLPLSLSKRQSQRALETQQKAPTRPASVVKLRIEEDLAKRRKLELALVMKHDKRAIKRGECWFLLDAAWMRRWVAFVGQDGPLPGPISNDALLQPEWRERLSGDLPGKPEATREGLTTPSDYRCVNPMVWSILSELHGPGDAPLLARCVPVVIATSANGHGAECVVSDGRCCCPLCVSADTSLTLGRKRWTPRASLLSCASHSRRHWRSCRSC